MSKRFDRGRGGRGTLAWTVSDSITVADHDGRIGDGNRKKDSNGGRHCGGEPHFSWLFKDDCEDRKCLEGMKPQVVADPFILMRHRLERARFCHNVYLTKELLEQPLGCHESSPGPLEYPA